MISKRKHFADEAKNKFVKDFTVFYYSGFSRERFLESLYKSIRNMFGHIAEFDKNGFYHRWFEKRPVCKTCNQIINTSDERWIIHITSIQPEHIHTDLEKFIVQFIKSDREMRLANTTAYIDGDGNPEIPA